LQEQLELDRTQELGRANDHVSALVGAFLGDTKTTGGSGNTCGNACGLLSTLIMAPCLLCCGRQGAVIDEKPIEQTIWDASNNKTARASSNQDLKFAPMEHGHKLTLASHPGQSLVLGSAKFPFPLPGECVSRRRCFAAARCHWLAESRAYARASQAHILASVPNGLSLDPRATKRSALRSTMSASCVWTTAGSAFMSSGVDLNRRT
jgi:hypothetical protein